MSYWNYVVTAQKPTSVTHSTFGNFTSPKDKNLIIAKCTRIEIHLVTQGGLELLKEVPVYGRIATLELFRPNGETQDLLLFTTEKYKFCILQWDSDVLELVTREVGVVSPEMHHTTDNGQICIIDDVWGLIGVYLYDKVFRVMDFNSKGQLKELYTLSRQLEEEVLDIKFLYGCSRPTIVVLYKDENDDRHVKTYDVLLEDRDLGQGPWSYDLVTDNDGADLLIPVPPPLSGVIIVGKKLIVFCNEIDYQGISITPCQLVTRAYGRIDTDGFQYLFGDHAGLLLRLVITRDDREIVVFKFELLGETSIASTISYLDNAFVFVGSSCGDSQLIKLDAEGSCVKIIKTYVNLGPIVDFCVDDHNREGLSKIVTCSGGSKDSSLRVIGDKIEIIEKALVEIQGIKGMWSLRSLSDDAHDTLLVISFINETKILAMNLEGVLAETENDTRFDSEVQTLFCYNALNNQLVQVTSSSVRLVNFISGELLDEWKAPERYNISVATAYGSQVLVAVGGGPLVYLEIRNGDLNEVKCLPFEYSISCLDLNPLVENANNSSLAAVGMWTEISVRMYSLPELILITKVNLGEIIPRNVLLCSLDGISYLLCALGNGHLLSFIINMSSGAVGDKKRVSLGTQPFTLRKFSSKNATHIFAASDTPTIIHSSNKMLIYDNVDLKEVSHMCPFNSAAFPESFAFAKEDTLSIAMFGEVQKCRSFRLKGEHARYICHQEQTQTYAICSLKYNQESAGASEMHFVHLIDDQTFKVLSTFALDTHECGCSILSCSFSSDDLNPYYCVGTAYDLPEKSEPTKGRIFIFVVENKMLKLVAGRETKGAVYSLNSFNGKLLASVNQKIQLYKWMLRDDGTPELQFECKHHGHILSQYVQTRGDFIVVGDLMKSVSLLIYKQEGVIEEHAKDDNDNWMTAIEILNDNVYLGAENNFNLFTLREHSEPVKTTRRKNIEGATTKERARLEVVGEYHVGESICRFRHGSLDMRFQDLEIAQIPTVIFGTVNGVIGVIASLPIDQYLLLEKLQSKLRKVIKGVGGLTHEDWRAVYKDKKKVEAINFLDGDLIESFLELNCVRKEEISKSMALSVNELCKRVEDLSRLH